MKERPILFSGPMVRALLDGSKTQTRRAVRKQFAPDAVVAEVAATTPEGWQVSGHSGLWWDDAGACLDDAIRCPYGMPGDRLWVREAWSHDAESLEQCRAAHEDAMGGSGYGPYYHATETAPDTLKWRPSIHMPRWASRITLEIVAVRVERLLDISEADARAEGARECDPATGREVLLAGPSQRGSFVLHYRSIWEQINGPGSWAENPWVWVVEFKRVTPA